MPISTPNQITVPFATSGLKNAIPAAANPVTGNAGYDAGFPATNMTPKEAGGIPPFGQDFNGILFDITTALQFIEAGGVFPYSSSFATAVGGYPVGATVLRSDGAGLWRNTTPNNTSNPESFGVGWQPEGSVNSSIAMSNANVTLSAVQAARNVILITGTLTANLNMIFPTYQRQWSVVNNATGAFSVTCKTASGSGVAVPTGSSVLIYGDGTNISSIATGTSGITAPQFDNTTKFATTAFVQGVGFQFSGLTGISANTTLTASSAGGMVYSTSATPLNATLPLASSVPAKTTITFWNFGSGFLNLICSGSDGMYTNQIVSTYQLVTGASITLVSNGGAAWLAIGMPNTVGITGAFKNLSGSATGLSAATSYTVDEITVSNPAGFYQTLRSVSISPSFAVAGAGGLDVGAANSQAASTWYSVWVIWSGAVTSGLLSLSATSPTMPIGYTHKARVGWVRTDSTANKFPLRFFQSGRSVQYSIAPTGNSTNVPIMITGTTGSVTTPTYTTVPVVNFVPPTAGKIKFSIRGTENGMVFLCAPNGNYGTNQAETSPPAFMGLPAGQGGVIVYPFEFVLEESNIYYASNAANSRLRCMGWEDNL